MSTYFSGRVGNMLSPYESTHVIILSYIKQYSAKQLQHKNSSLNNSFEKAINVYKYNIYIIILNINL